MSRILGRIWVRFGLWISATVFLTLGILATSMLLFGQAQYRNFERSLPPPVREELESLVNQNLGDSPRANEIYGKYWRGDQLFGERLSLLIGLAVCLPAGLIAGFWVSRTVTLPLGSIASAAQRIAQGDLSVRAEPLRERGEMADMVRNFNDMTDALARFERERKETAAAISHELRTPLTILCARLHAVCDGVIAPSPEEFRHLLNQSEHLARLVDDLHTLSMAEAGKLTLHRERIDLVELVRSTLDSHSLRLAQHHMETELALRVESVWVHADRDRLRQVLSNLIENATRHARAGRWMALGVDQVGDTALVTVSDAGPGLSNDIQRQMFQRFIEPDRPRSRLSDGSGLGLSIVHMLVAQHDGQVSADTSERGGMRFNVRLPVVE